VLKFYYCLPLFTRETSRLTRVIVVYVKQSQVNAIPYYTPRTVCSLIVYLAEGYCQEWFVDLV